MKKNISYFILLSFLVFHISSCSSSGSVASGNSSSNGKLSKILVQIGSGSYSLNFNYDNNNKLIRYYTFEGGQILESWTFTRNENGKMIEETFNNTSANYSEVTSFKLNSNGQYIYSIKIPNNVNASRDSVVYFYNGNKIEQTYTFTSYRNGPWSFYKKDRYTYDINSNIIKTELMNSITNQWTVSKTYSYDNNPSALELDDDNINSIFGNYNNVLNEASSSYNFSYTYTYGSNNRPSSASVLRTYTSSPTQTENWTYYY